VEQEIEFSDDTAPASEEATLAAARQRVKLLLILQQIAEAEGIEVDSRDVDDRIELLASQGESSAQSLRRELEQKGGLERLQLFLLAEVTMDFILDLSPADSG
jgi:FKBP-type peptidyl-prolyl cis-trans isomerase (trigger factor)